MQRRWQQACAEGTVRIAEAVTLPAFVAHAGLRRERRTPTTASRWSNKAENTRMRQYGTERTASQPRRACRQQAARRTMRMQKTAVNQQRHAAKIDARHVTREAKLDVRAIEEQMLPACAGSDEQRV